MRHRALGSLRACSNVFALAIVPARTDLCLHQWPEDFAGRLDSELVRELEHPALVQWLELMPSPDWMCRSEVLLPRLPVGTGSRAMRDLMRRLLLSAAGALLVVFGVLMMLGVLEQLGRWLAAFSPGGL